MLCKIEGCGREIPGVQGEGFYDKKEYIRLCPAHKMAYLRYGNVLGKQPIRQVCKWCNCEFNKKRLSDYCSKGCRNKGSSQERTASGKNRESVVRFIRNNPEKARAIWNRYKDKAMKKYPERFKARAIAQKQIPIQPCSVCGTTEGIERHHEDYSKPLEVICLCKDHHVVLHR